MTSNSSPPRRVRFTDERRSRRDNRNSICDRSSDRERRRDRSLRRDGSYDSQRSCDHGHERLDDRDRRYDYFSAHGTERLNHRDGDSYPQREWRGASRGSYRDNRRRQAIDCGRRSRSCDAEGIGTSCTCPRCGGWQHVNVNDCPAINQKCRHCGQFGHFLRVCRSRGNPQIRNE